MCNEHFHLIPFISIRLLTVCNVINEFTRFHTHTSNIESEWRTKTHANRFQETIYFHFVGVYIFQYIHLIYELINTCVCVCECTFERFNSVTMYVCVGVCVCVVAYMKYSLYEIFTNRIRFQMYLSRIK